MDDLLVLLVVSPLFFVVPLLALAGLVSLLLVRTHREDTRRHRLFRAAQRRILALAVRPWLRWESSDWMVPYGVHLHPDALLWRMQIHTRNALDARLEPQAHANQVARIDAAALSAGMPTGKPVLELAHYHSGHPAVVTALVEHSPAAAASCAAYYAYLGVPSHRLVPPHLMEAARRYRGSLRGDVGRLTSPAEASRNAHAVLAWLDPRHAEAYSSLIKDWADDPADCLDVAALL